MGAAKPLLSTNIVRFSMRKVSNAGTSNNGNTYMYHVYDHPRHCITSENEEHIRTNSQVPHETRMTSSAAGQPCRAVAAAQRFVARYDIQDGLECTRTCSNHHYFVMIIMRTSFHTQVIISQ